MGSQTRRQLGFANNQVKGSDWSYFAGCGGFGAGACHSPATYSYMYWPIKVEPFSVRNLKLVLHNDGFAPYTDTPTGPCTHNAGSQAGFDVLLLYQEPVGTLDRSKATGIITVPSSITFPYELEFDAANIPQPDNVLYGRKIWVALDFGTTGLMLNDLPQINEAMKTVKLNKESNT